MYRQKNNQLEFFLVHPGGPFYAKKDLGVWDLPKGEVQAGAELFAEAQREFEEETGIKPPENLSAYLPLGTITMKSGKIVHAWAFEKDFEGTIKSNTCEIEWPPMSGKKIEIPEVDRGEFFNLAAAQQKAISSIFELLLRLDTALK